MAECAIGEVRTQNGELRTQKPPPGPLPGFDINRSTFQLPLSTLKLAPLRLKPWATDPQPFSRRGHSMSVDACIRTGEISRPVILVHDNDRMSTFARLLALLLALSFVAFDVPAQNIGSARARDTWSIATPAAASPREAAATLIRERSKTLAGGDALELSPPVERDSLTGRHFYFAQTVGNVPVLNGGVSVSIFPDGTAGIHDRTAIPRFDFLRIGNDEATVIARGAGRAFGATEVESVNLVGWIGDDGELRPYRRVVVRDGLRRHAIMIDATSGLVAWSEPLYATARGQVFDSNPVTSLNDPTLLDGDDAASAVPSGAYSAVDLPGLGGSGPLVGPYASIVDMEIPTTVRADQGASLEVTRDRDEFEEVNAYFQIDRAQRYLRSLGFVGNHEIVPYALEVDAHAGAGVDDSSYRYTEPGRGRLYFGDGGVDDAEDADIVLHEFGHAIQDSIVPTGFSGPAPGEARALGEGFSDYWAFSSGWIASRASGRDPFCIGDWDARCAPGPSTQCGYTAGENCLRRVDGTKTMADYRRGGSSGIEHINGEIWSSALREIFVKAVAAYGDDEGRRIVDRTLLESHFGLPPNPTFRTASLRFIDSDRRLNNGALTPSICIAMSARGIIEGSECDLGLRGDLTLVASPARDLAIPDFDPKGVDASLRVSDSRIARAVYVRVDIVHPNRGDLRLTLVAPDGTNVVLQVETLDAGDDIHAVYGLDAEPSQPLSVLADRSVAGTWTLHMVDTVGADVGRLVAWGMMFRFAGDAPIDTRGAPDPSSRFIPVAGSVEGAFGTRFVSDARIVNVGATAARATLFFTPSGTDGSTTFSAVKLEIPPGEILALDDFVRSLFRESGPGAVEIRGESAGLIVTSRIYNDTGHGTYGQFVRVGSESIGNGPGVTLHILHLSNGPAFRSNLGVAEVGGGGGAIIVRLIDASGALIKTEEVALSPFGHLQIPLLGGPAGTPFDAFRAEVSVSSGTARVVAYGSVIDNSSGDAIFVPGSISSGSQVTPPPNPFVIPAVIRAPGANGTYWRSDVRVLNRSSSLAQHVAFTFAPADGGERLTTSIEIPANGIAVIDDALHMLFSEENGRGSLAITSLDFSDTRASLVVTSRTWTTGPSGTFGQFIPASSPAFDAIERGGVTASLIHVDSNSAFRCNVGLTEVEGFGVVVRTRLLDASGVERFSTQASVPAHGNVQFNLAAVGAPAISNGRLTFEVTEGEGRVLPYASVVDNATGDPIFVSP